MRESLSKSSKTKVQVKGVVKSGGTKSAPEKAVKTKAASEARKPVKAMAAKKAVQPKKAKAAVKAVKTVKAKVVVKAAKAASKPVSAKKIVKPVKAVKKAKVARAPVAPSKKAKTAAKKAPVKAVRKAVARAAGTKAAKRPAGRVKSAGRTTASPVRTVRRKKLALPMIITPAPLPPEPPRRQMSTAGLKAFEQAVKIFNRRHYPEAKAAFENLAVKFPQEVEIIARAQTYIHVCSQKMAHAHGTPRNAEELYDRGVFALNIGDFTQARSFFEKALRLRPDEPYLLYSLAATHAQTGSHDQALDYLRRSIQIQPRFRAQALNDMDFSGLRENKRFLELLGLASPFDLLEARK